MVGPKVLIGVITGEYARRADFYDYYNLMHRPAQTMLILCHDRSPAHGRNLLIQAALDYDCTHVLFVDDDMAYKPDSLLQLLEHDRDIVSGLYYSRAYPHPPLVFDVADEDGACLPMYLMNDDVRLKPIVAAGFGFLLVKTDVFKKMEKPWVRLGELNQEEWCDDIGFFKRVREAGIESFVDLECKVGHMGTFIIWPNRDEGGNWISTYDTNGAGAISVRQITAQPPKYEFVK